jgi:hypothetical protein
MNDGDSIHLSEQLDTLKDLLAKNTQTTERVLWIISDPETGLIRRVGDIGLIASKTVVDQVALAAQVQAIVADVARIQERQDTAIILQNAHDDSIRLLLKESNNGKEAKKPLIAMGYELLGKLLWVVALGVIAWLGYCYLAIK